MGSEEFVETREAGEGEHGFDYGVVILLVSGQTNACVDLSCWNSSRLVYMIHVLADSFLQESIHSVFVEIFQAGNFSVCFLVFESI